MKSACDCAHELPRTSSFLLVECHVDPHGLGEVRGLKWRSLYVRRLSLQAVLHLRACHFLGYEWRLETASHTAMAVASHVSFEMDLGM